MKSKAIPALIAAALPAAAGLVFGLSPTLRLPVVAFVAYASFAVLIIGFVGRVLRWAAVPVPFRIPTTCGQQRSLPQIKSAVFDNPSNGWAVAVRMGLEVLVFRSLFRNTRGKVVDAHLFFLESRWLWLAALAFHWGLLVVVLRHLRLFVEPVPYLALLVERVDGIFEIGLPHLYLSDVALAAGLAFLLCRRLIDPALACISLFADYLVVWLLAGIAGTGLLMRHVERVDVAAVKQFALGLAGFHPVLPGDAGPLFLAHLFLVCALAVCLPFSKLMHMAGVWFSPTRNLANNNRAVRHVNPWNQPVKTHGYREWENEYRDKLEAAGIPLEASDVKTTC